MKKRAFAILFLLVMVFTVTGLRMISLAKNTNSVSVSPSAKTIDITTLRGTVYDCNLQPLTNSETVLYAAAKPSPYSLGQLSGKVTPEVFKSVTERVREGKPVAVVINSSIIPNEDIKEIRVPQRYPSSSFACHIIGYTDSSGHGISGIEKAYDSLLSQVESTVTARFLSDANGRVMLGEEIEISGNNIPRKGVVLTIDKNIQRITEDALDRSGTDRASAIVIEVESGAIRACVSRPAFDPYNIADSLDNVNSPLINRAFLPFSVGSVFKPVVAAAALENGISENYEYNCTGSVVHNGVTFNCHKKDGHGVVNMETAVANSCNTYFISLAISTGADNIISMAESFGFGKEAVLADGIKASSGYLPDASEIDSKAAISNISFGQGALLATPLQICNVAATVARGGVYIEPYLIEGETDENGVFTKIKSYSEKKQVMSYDNALLIRRFLEKVVTDGSGVRAESELFGIAGKTATAQTGTSINGAEIYNAWFMGYFPADNPKYAVVILKENGGEGAVSCAPVFKEIAENMVKNPKIIK